MKFMKFMKFMPAYSPFETRRVRRSQRGGGMLIWKIRISNIEIRKGVTKPEYYIGFYDF